MSSVISPNSFATGSDGKIYWVTTVDSLKINDSSIPSVILGKQNLTSIIPKKIVIPPGEPESVQSPKPTIRSDTSILNINNVQSSSNDSTCNNSQNTEQETTTSPIAGSPKQEDKPAKSSPKFKTVKIKRNGVIQTLLVPALQGVNDSLMQQTDSPSQVLQNSKVKQPGDTKDCTTTVLLKPKSFANCPGSFIPIAPSVSAASVADTSPTVVTIPNNWNKNNSILICTDGSVKSKQVPVAHGVNTADKNSVIVVGDPAHLNTGNKVHQMPVLRSVLTLPEKVTQSSHGISILSNTSQRTATDAEGDTLKIQSVFSLNKQHQSLMTVPKTDNQNDTFTNCSDIINIEPKSDEFDASVELDVGNEKPEIQKAKPTIHKPERLKRKASTQGNFGCKNCPGCSNQSRKRKRKQDLYCDKNIMSLKQNFDIKDMTISLRRVKMGRKHSLSMKKFKKLNPAVAKKKNFARKSTSKACKKVKTQPEPSVHPPLNFSKYYLVRAPTGTYLVPRSSEVPPGEPSPVLFRVVNYNTGRAVAIKTKKGVEKMFVKAMGTNEVPDGLTDQVKAMTKPVVPPTTSPEQHAQIKVKTERFAEGLCDRVTVTKRGTLVVNGEHSDTESASEGVRGSESSEINESKEETVENNEPPVLEPQLSATERLEMLRNKLKSQMEQLDQVRTSAESAKQLLESLDNDDD